MTRNEFERFIAVLPSNSPRSILDALSKLGLIKFDPEPSVREVFKIWDEEGRTNSRYLYNENRDAREIIQKYGTIKIEIWPEGLVLWVGGEIAWKSWNWNKK